MLIPVYVVTNFIAKAARSDAQREVSFPIDVEWDDFRDRMCANLDVDPKGAELGYKLSSAKQKEPVTALSSDEQFRAVIDRLVQHNQHPNTRHERMIIVSNLSQVRASKVINLSHRAYQILSQSLP